MCMETFGTPCGSLTLRVDLSSDKLIYLLKHCYKYKTGVNFIVSLIQ